MIIENLILKNKLVHITSDNLGGVLSDVIIRHLFRNYNIVTEVINSFHKEESHNLNNVVKYDENTKIIITNIFNISEYNLNSLSKFNNVIIFQGIENNECTVVSTSNIRVVSDTISTPDILYSKLKYELNEQFNQLIKINNDILNNNVTFNNMMYNQLIYDMGFEEVRNTLLSNNNLDTTNINNEVVEYFNINKPKIYTNIMVNNTSFTIGLLDKYSSFTHLLYPTDINININPYGLVRLKYKNQSLMLEFNKYFIEQLQQNSVGIVDIVNVINYSIFNLTNITIKDIAKHIKTIFNIVENYKELNEQE